MIPLNTKELFRYKHFQSLTSTMCAGIKLVTLSGTAIDFDYNITISDMYK